MKGQCWKLSHCQKGKDGIPLIQDMHISALLQSHWIREEGQLSGPVQCLEMEAGDTDRETLASELVEHYFEICPKC